VVTPTIYRLVQEKPLPRTEKGREKKRNEKKKKKETAQSKTITLIPSLSEATLSLP